MIVPLRPFGSAVRRNYARRRLREFFRRKKDIFPQEADSLVRLFKAPGDWDGFLAEVERLARKASHRRKIEPQQDHPRRKQDGSGTK